MFGYSILRKCLKNYQYNIRESVFTKCYGNVWKMQVETILAKYYIEYCANVYPATFGQLMCQWQKLACKINGAVNFYKYFIISVNKGKFIVAEFYWDKVRGTQRRCR